METSPLRELLAFFASSDVITLDFKDGDTSLSLSRAASQTARTTTTSLKNGHGEAALAPIPSAPTEAQADAPSFFCSPMVGTFYAASTPGDPPFVEVGDAVSAGAPVCIIEAMKLLNEVEIDRAGVIVKVLVKDGDLVEYGQPLFEIGEAACSRRS